MHRRSAVVVAVAGVLAFARPARAQDPPGRTATPGLPSGQSSHAAVSVVLAGDDASVTSMTDVLRELLRRLSTEIALQRVPAIRPVDVLDSAAAPGVRARVWVDLTAEVARVYLADATGQRFLVRNFPRAGALAAVAREQIAQVVTASVDAMLQGDEIGITRAQARVALGAGDSLLTPPRNNALAGGTDVRPRVPEEVIAVQPPRNDARLARRAPAGTDRAGNIGLALSVSYRFSVYAPPVSPLQHGPGAALTMRIGGPRVSALASAQFALALPHHVDGAPIGVRLDTGVVRLAGGVAATVHRGWTLWLLASAGIDLVQISPTLQFGATATLAPSRLSVVPMAGGLAGIDLHASDRVMFSVGLGIDIDLRGTHYVVSNGAENIDVVAPWAVRPAAELALRVILAGPSNATAR